MRKETRIISGLVTQPNVTPVGKPALDPAPATPFNFRGEGAKHVFGRTSKRALLSLAIGGIAAAGAGCLSIHTHKDVEQPAPVVVAPNNPPNP